MEGRPRCGEGDAEFGPAVGVVGGVGMSAVGGGEGGDDGQAEAAAATAAGGVGAGESVEGDGRKWSANPGPWSRTPMSTAPSRACAVTAISPSPWVMALSSTAVRIRRRWSGSIETNRSGSARVVMSAPVAAKRATLSCSRGVIGTALAEGWDSGRSARARVSSWSASPLSRRVSSSAERRAALSWSAGLGRRSAVRVRWSAVPTGCVIRGWRRRRTVVRGRGPVAVG